MTETLFILAFYSVWMHDFRENAIRTIRTMTLPYNQDNDGLTNGKSSPSYVMAALVVWAELLGHPSRVGWVNESSLASRYVMTEVAYMAASATAHGHTTVQAARQRRPRRQS